LIIFLVIVLFLFLFFLKESVRGKMVDEREKNWIFLQFQNLIIWVWYLWLF